MKTQSSYFFVSYSSKDKDIVLRIIDELDRIGVETWGDTRLRPGESWEKVIQQHLEGASGLLLFVSENSIKSQWVIQELEAVARGDRPIIPVLLDPISFEAMPTTIRRIQWITFRHKDFQKSVQAIAQAINYWLDRVDIQQEGLNLKTENVEQLAAITAQQARGETDKEKQPTNPPDSVFIVHGHDTQLLDEVEKYILSLGIKPVVLSKMSNKQQTLIEKFLAYGQKARYAVVLISPDDQGASNRDYLDPTGGQQTLQFRARQNVILELGFFYGLLGFEHVFALYKKPERVFPRFERPSDLDGVLFEEVEPTGQWKPYLKERLKEAGFVIP